MGRRLPNSCCAARLFSPAGRLVLVAWAAIALPVALAGCKSQEMPAEDLRQPDLSAEDDLSASDDLRQDDLRRPADLAEDLAMSIDQAAPDLRPPTPDLTGVDGCGDTSSDPLNCGACGNRCADGALCCAGACRDPLSDPANCRTCGHSCGGNACCGGLCTSLSSPQNCGACGVSCAAGKGCCAGACVDQQRDAQNCGGCGITCAAGSVCASGRCYAADGGLPDMSGPGCLIGGRTPPAACFAGTDPMSGSPWTICRADCMSAWVHHADPGGGVFAYQTICKSLGYSGAAQNGGTCGDICGYCEGRMSSCMSPGSEKYDGGGSCGADCLQRTVMWQCVR